MKSRAYLKHKALYSAHQHFVETDRQFTKSLAWEFLALFAAVSFGLVASAFQAVQ